MATTQPHRESQDERKTYQLSKDSVEHDQLDRQSASLVALMNHRPFHAPISQPQLILHIGCGTGSMTNLLASAYPEAHVIDMDISPVSSRHRKRSNVEFVQGDIRDILSKEPRPDLGSFDYIFQRLGFYTITEWDVYLESVSKMLSPGGWLEIQEVSAQLYSEHGDRIFDGEKWYNEFYSNAAALGLNIEVGDSLRELVAMTPGLTSVRQHVYEVAPKGREEAPELEGFEGQIADFFSMIIRKITSAKGRDEAYVEQLVKEMEDRYERGFEEGDRYRMVAVVGQRKEEECLT